jgi:two-component system phosphate regulon sensor histidine kinase PhoR
MNIWNPEYFLHTFIQAIHKPHDTLQRRSGDIEERRKEHASSRIKALERQLNALRIQEAKDKALIESINEGVIAFDHDMNILFANKASKQMLSMENEDLLGKPLTEVIRAEDEDGAPIQPGERAARIALTSGKSVTLKYYYVRRDGSRFPVLVTASPIIYEGRVTGMVNTFRDITKEVKLDRAKNEFVLLVSHQLRTPPTGIKWFTTMLLSEDAGPINTIQREYLREILYNTERMIDIVGTMLSISRIEMGIFSVNLQPTDISSIIEDVLSEIAPQRAEKDITIEKDYIAPMPLVSADPMLLRIIFQNLIFNAVKYTPPKGKIVVKLSILESEIHFSVKDTGFGIPAKDQGKIFTKFFRAGNVRKIDPSGTGLGLYIVKLIVSEIGGTIRFTSEENKGSMFFVTLPMKGHLVHQNITG